MSSDGFDAGEREESRVMSRPLAWVMFAEMGETGGRRPGGNVERVAGHVTVACKGGTQLRCSLRSVSLWWAFTDARLACHPRGTFRSRGGESKQERR